MLRSSVYGVESPPRQQRLWQTMRSVLFPVESNEFPLFLPLLGLYFCLSFVYNGMRPLKIALVTAVSDAGAEVIPFLKVWGILPGALVFTFLFTQVSGRMKREQVMYLFLGIFAAYYSLFSFVLLPNSDWVALDGLAAFLRGVLPTGFRGLIAMLQYWHVSLFYVMCEVWSSTVMFILFWGFVNEITPMAAAKRFYPLYNLGGNLASTVAGALWLQSEAVGRQLAWPFPQSPVANLTCAVVLWSGLAIVVAGLLIRRAHQVLGAAQPAGGGKKSAASDDPAMGLSLRAAVNQVVRSQYLLCLLVLVIAYNLVFNLTDVLWNHEVRNYFGNDQIKMAGFIGRVTMYKGILSTGLVFVAHVIIARCGWMWATLLTPVIILSTSLVFFPIIALQASPEAGLWAAELFGFDMTWLAVVLGGAQNALARGTKYSIYDATRELAFIPLRARERRNGKAVIDGIASRIGKSSGSVILMVLMPLCASLQATIPYIAVIAISVTVLWVWSIVRLDTLIKNRE